MKFRKFLSVALASSFVLQGCSSDSNKPKKSELSGSIWFDYGNGLINLSRITRITSTALLYGEVMPKEYFDNKDNFYSGYYDNLPVEKKAIVDAHANYCFDNLKDQGSTERSGFTWSAFNQNATLGVFETKKGQEDLAKQISSLKTSISPEFAQNCVIELRGSASIKFDDFTVNLEPYDTTIEFSNTSGELFTINEIDESFNEKVGDLQNGKTPWDGIYTSLIKN